MDRAEPGIRLLMYLSHPRAPSQKSRIQKVVLNDLPRKTAQQGKIAPATGLGTPADPCLTLYILSFPGLWDSKFRSGSLPEPVRVAKCCT